MAAILDRVLGIDKPKKKKKRHTNDEPDHRHPSRSDKPHASRSRAVPPELAADPTTTKDPQTQEGLRKARVDYWLRPTEERGRRDGLLREQQSDPTASSASTSSNRRREKHKTTSRAEEMEPSDFRTRPRGRKRHGSSQGSYTNVYGPTSHIHEELDTERGMMARSNDADRQSRRSSKTSAPTAFVRRTNTARRPSDTTSIMSSRPALHRSRTTGQVRVNSQPFSAASNRPKLIALSEAASKASRRSSRPAQSRTTTWSPVIEVSPLNKPERPQLQRRQTEPPQQTIECSICADKFPPPQIESLTCAHKWCHTCLKRTYFVTNDGHYIDKEPKCCDQLIQLSIASTVLTPTEQKQWNRKMRERKTENPVYCSTKSCSNRWISPRHIFGEGKKQVGQCTKCNKQVCVLCKKPAHGSKPCIKDYTDKEMLAYALRKGWKRCPKCQIIIQRDHGCTHMTCRNCGENFCYSCGVAYTNLMKNCTCELIDAIPDDEEDAEMARRVQFRQWADMIVEGEAMLARHAPMRGFGAAAADALNTWLGDADFHAVPPGNPMRRPVADAAELAGAAAAPALANRWFADHEWHAAPARTLGDGYGGVAATANRWQTDGDPNANPLVNPGPGRGQRPRGHVANNWFAEDIHD